MRRKTLNNLRLLKIDTGGQMAEVGLAINELPQGLALGATPATLGDAARQILSNGAMLSSAGAPEEQFEDIPHHIPCNQIGVATVDATGEAVLVLRFGCFLLTASVPSNDLKQALGLLHTGAQAGLHAVQRAD